jgi:hypothetical protein
MYLKWIIASSLLLFSLLVFAQKSPNNSVKSLKGRVVATQEDGQKGVSGVTVSIKDFDYDISNQDGYFELNVPLNQDFVTIIIENTAMQLIKPNAGLVQLPQSQQVELVLCGAENQKLLQEARLLQSKISKLEKSKQLSSRQLALLHDKMLDTIIFYQRIVGDFQTQLSQTKAQNNAQNALIEAQQLRIRMLEDSVKSLSNALFEAMQTRFLHQKTVYDQVSSQFLVYLDRIKDLRDRSTADRMTLCFLSNEAGQELNKTLQKYNAAREPIMNNYEMQINDTKAFWENPQVAMALESTFEQLLKNTHQQYVLPLDGQAFEQMRLYATGQKGRIKAEKEAKRVVNGLLPDLNVAIETLEQNINNTLNIMSINN